MVEEQKNNGYELVSENEVEYLRKEVEKLKKNPFGDAHSSKTLLDSMDQLSSKLDKLVNIFETASDDIVRDYKEQSTNSRIDNLMEQNEKLAKGMIVIADLLKELKDYKKEQKEIKDSFAALEKRVNQAPAPAQPSPNLNKQPDYPGPFTSDNNEEHNPFMDDKEIDPMDVPPPPR